MFERCRPAGRLFYLVLAVAVSTWSVSVSAREAASGAKAGKSATPPAARPAAAGPVPRAASPSPQSGLTMTDVVDTVSLANGSPAEGVLVISWPAFVTAGGTAVAPGVVNVTLGTNGALNVELASNANATPAGVYLYGRLPTWTWRSTDRILGGTSKFPGDVGAGADDAGIRDSGSAGIDAVS